MRNMTKRRRLLMVSSSSQGRLPIGFKEVKWLQGSGSQYCTTNILPISSANNYTSIKGNVTLLDKDNSKFAIATKWSTRTYGVISGYRSVPVSGGTATKTVFEYFYGYTSPNEQYLDLSNEVYPINIYYEINRNNLIYNNQEINKSFQTGTYQSGIPIAIGGINGSQSVSPYNTLAQFKEFSIYNDELLQYKFIPCYRESDNKTGFMQITVADESYIFLPNMGADEWILGPVV